MLALQAKQSELKTELKSAQKAELRQTAIQQMEKLADELLSESHHLGFIQFSLHNFLLAPE